MNTNTIRIAALVLALIATPTLAQERALSLEEVLALYERSGIELRVARSQLSSELGAFRQSRAVSNPSLSVTHEDLGSYSERYFNVTQRADFLWLGDPRHGAADARVNAARAQFLADSALIVQRLKQTFVSAWRAGETVAALRDLNRVANEVLEDARERLEQGDIAGYDVRRLGVARATIGARLRRAEFDLADGERRLGAMTAADGTVSRVRALAPGGPPPQPPGGASMSGALTRRPELEAARAETEAFAADARLAGRSRFRNVDITGGYKRQSDGLDGLILGVQLPVPLFDRRGGDMERARAEVDRSQANGDLVAIAIAMEVALSNARLTAAREQRVMLEGEGIIESDQLLSTARVAYVEGEIGIAELVDAAEALLEARLLSIDVRASEWSAFFELEHAVGGFIDDNGADR